MGTRKHTSVVLNEKLQKQIEEECEKKGEGKSTVIRRVLEQYFRNDLITTEDCGRKIIIHLPSG